MIEDGWWNLSWQDDSWLVGWLQNWSTIMMTMTMRMWLQRVNWDHREVWSWILHIDFNLQQNMSPFLVNLFAEIWEKGWGVKGAEASLPVKSRKFVDQLIDLIEKIVGHREESLQGNSDHKDGQGHDSAESKLDVPAELSLRSFFSRAEDIPNFCRFFLHLNGPRLKVLDMYIPTAAAFGGMCIGGETQWVADLQNVVPLNLANETRKWRLKRDSLHSFSPSWISEKVVFFFYGRSFTTLLQQVLYRMVGSWVSKLHLFSFWDMAVGKLEVPINQPIFITESTWESTGIEACWPSWPISWEPLAVELVSFWPSPGCKMMDSSDVRSRITAFAKGWCGMDWGHYHLPILRDVLQGLDGIVLGEGDLSKRWRSCRVLV